jgi:hypothetical protein
MRAMTKTAIVGCLPLVVLLGGCKKREPAPPSTAGRPALSQPPIPPPPPPPPGVGSAEVEELLTEDKLKRFLTYQQAMAAATPEATALGAAAGPAALAKSGLTPEEVPKLSRLLMPYYARVAGIQNMMKRSEAARLRVEEAKRAGQEPSPVDLAIEKTLDEQGKRLDTLRKEFGTRYGEGRLALLAKHEADFLPIHLRMMSAALGGRGMHRPPTPPPAPSPAMPPPAVPPAPQR